MSSVANVREKRRALLHEEENTFFEAVNVSLGRYLHIVVVNGTLGNSERKKVGSKRDDATKYTMPRPKREFGLQ